MCVFACVGVQVFAGDLTFHDGFQMVCISPGAAGPLIEHYGVNSTEGEQINTL